MISRCPQCNSAALSGTAHAFARRCRVRCRDCGYTWTIAGCAPQRFPPRDPAPDTPRCPRCGSARVNNPTWSDMSAWSLCADCAHVWMNAPPAADDRLAPWCNAFGWPKE